MMSLYEFFYSEQKNNRLFAVCHNFFIVYLVVFETSMAEHK
jgi:hypothetical protein